MNKKWTIRGFKKLPIVIVGHFSSKAPTKIEILKDCQTSGFQISENVRRQPFEFLRADNRYRILQLEQTTLKTVPVFKSRKIRRRIREKDGLAGGKVQNRHL